MRVLVTGGAGFLGSHLVERFRAEGLDPFVPRRSDYDLTVATDVERLFADARPELVIHLAAEVGGIGANRANPGRYWYANLMMGAHVLEQSRVHGTSKVVLIGTICAYPKFAPIPFHEDDLWNGYPEETNAPYGVAKKALLVGGQGYREQYGMDVVYLLPVNLYGPRDNFDLQTSHVIPALIRKMVEAQERGEREIVLWGDGSPTREFLYVDDCAEAIQLAAARYDGLEPVNLGTGQEISIRALAELIGELTGFDGEIVWDTSQPNGQPRRQLDVSRAEQLFGFRAHTELREGLERTIAWYYGRTGNGRRWRARLSRPGRRHVVLAALVASAVGGSRLGGRLGPPCRVALRRPGGDSDGPRHRAARAVVHGHLPADGGGFLWPLLTAPFAAAGAAPSAGLTALVLLNVVVLLPLALLAITGTMTRLAGRVLGVVSGLAWILVPLLGYHYFDFRMQPAVLDRFLPQVYGLSETTAFPGHGRPRSRRVPAGARARLGERARRRRGGHRRVGGARAVHPVDPLPGRCSRGTRDPAPLDFPRDRVCRRDPRVSSRPVSGTRTRRTPKRRCCTGTTGHSSIRTSWASASTSGACASSSGCPSPARSPWRAAPSRSRWRSSSGSGRPSCCEAVQTFRWAIRDHGPFPTADPLHPSAAFLELLLTAYPAFVLIVAALPLLVPRLPARLAKPAPAG